MKISIWVAPQDFNSCPMEQKLFPGQEFLSVYRNSICFCLKYAVKERKENKIMANSKEIPYKIYSGTISELI